MRECSVRKLDDSQLDIHIDFLGEQVFDYQPTRTGQLVHIRPIETEDRELLFRFAKDKELWEQHPCPNRWQRAEFDKYFDGALNAKAIVVVDRATGLAIGSSRFAYLDMKSSDVEIGWTFIARAYWGMGHNFDLKRLMVSHALEYLTSVYFLIGERNLRSLQAVKKIGAKFDCVVKNPPGRVQEQPSLCYRITRESFPTTPLCLEPF